MRRANYQIMKRTPSAIVIRDMGPWDSYMSVTNAAEDVVKELKESGELTPGRRLFYQDSEGDPGELVLDENQFFSGFAYWDGEA